jgi:hypothetical protein
MSKLNRRSSLLLSLLLAEIFCQIAGAQTTQATITGLVTDATGAVVPGVKVTAANVATGVRAETVSSSTGNYVIPNLPPGTYDVNVSAAGFKSWTRSGIVAFAKDNIRVDISLEVGQVSEQVTVTGAAPALKTESTEVSSTMERKLVEDMPVPTSGIGGGMRNVFNLMLMMPQVRTTNGESAWDDFIVGGGGQGFDWNVSVDGHSIEIGFRNHVGYMNRLVPTLDSVEETRIETAAFKAEDAHASGGMVTLTTKSGTNEFHGSAFDYYQSQRLNANSWGANRIGAPKAIFHRNDFGVTASGPVFIPKVYNGKNRTYWLLSLEGFRQPSSSGQGLLTVPTAAMKQGDFSGWTKANGTLIPIYDPATTKSNPSGGFTRQPFPGNIIPANRITPTAVNIMQFMPAPTISTASVLSQYGAMINNLRTTGTAPTQFINNGLTLRLDQDFGVKNRLSFTFTRNGSWYQNAYDDPANRSDWNVWGARLPFPLAGRTYYLGDQYYGDVLRVNDTHMITPTLINTATLGYHRLYHPEHDVTAYPKGQTDFCKIVGPLSNNPGCSNAMLAVWFDTDNFYSWDPTKDYDEFHNIYGVDDNVAWIKGSHSFKFGYGYQMLKLNRNYANNKAGTVHFSRLETSVPTDNSGNSGSSFASFLLGAVDSGALETGYAQGLRYPSHYVFAQDDWKITPRLTANLGFRLEINPPIYDKYDQLSYFDPTLANPAADGYPGAVRFLGFGPGRDNKRTFYGTQKGYGPRVGLAYRIGKDTVVRAGFGMFYSNYKMMGGNAGFQANPTWVSPDTGVTAAFNWNDGWPGFQPPPFINPAYNVGSSYGLWYYLDQLNKLPTSTTWNLAISHALPGNFVLDVTYTGTKGTHLASNRINYMQVDPRYASLGSLLNRPITDPAVTALGFTSPFPDFVQLMGKNATLKQSLRLFPQYTSVGGSSWTEYDGNSTYNALMIKVTKRFSHGLSMLADYTWSKMLTDADMALPGVAIGAGVGFGAAQNNLNRRLEKSYSALDIPHQFKLTMSYELPFGRGKPYIQTGLGRWVLGGWTVSTYSYVQDGFPLGVVDNGYSNNLFSGPPRPNETTNNWLSAAAANGCSSFGWDKGLYLDPSAFVRRTNPAVDPFGDAPRLNGAARSCGIARINTTVTRAFSIKERARAEVRWEAYDLLNAKTWSVPTLDLSNPLFGKVTGAAGNRTMQLGLRVNW